MNKKDSQKGIVSLEDVVSVINKWRDSCAECGEIPIGAYTFISLNDDEHFPSKFALFGEAELVGIQIDELTNKYFDVTAESEDEGKTKCECGGETQHMIEVSSESI